MPLSDLPPSLHTLAPMLQLAEHCEVKDPILCFAVREAILRKVKNMTPPPSDVTGFLHKLTKLQENSQNPNLQLQKERVEAKIKFLVRTAEDDSETDITRLKCRNACLILLDVLGIFGPMDDEFTFLLVRVFYSGKGQQGQGQGLGIQPTNPKPNAPMAQLSAAAAASENRIIKAIQDLNLNDPVTSAAAAASENRIMTAIKILSHSVESSVEVPTELFAIKESLDKISNYQQEYESTQREFLNRINGRDKMYRQLLADHCNIKITRKNVEINQLTKQLKEVKRQLTEKIGNLEDTTRSKNKKDRRIHQLETEIKTLKKKQKNIDVTLMEINKILGSIDRKIETPPGCCTRLRQRVLEKIMDKSAETALNAINKIVKFQVNGDVEEILKDGALNLLFGTK